MEAVQEQQQSWSDKHFECLIDKRRRRYEGEDMPLSDREPKVSTWSKNLFLWVQLYIVRNYRPEHRETAMRKYFVRNEKNARTLLQLHNDPKCKLRFLPVHLAELEQVANLEEEDELTPEQISAALKDNNREVAYGEFLMSQWGLGTKQ